MTNSQMSGQVRPRGSGVGFQEVPRRTDDPQGLNKLMASEAAIGAQVSFYRGQRPKTTNKTSTMRMIPSSKQMFTSRILPIDWKMIAGVDIDKILGGGWNECESLQRVLPSVTFSSLADEFPESPLPDGVVKIQRLAQLIIQYLLHSQDRLTDAVEMLQKTNETLRKEHHKLERKTQEAEQEIKSMRVECKKRRKMIEIQQNCLLNRKDPTSFEKCGLCPKTFINRSYLDSHLQRRHGNQSSVPPTLFPQGQTQRDDRSTKETGKIDFIASSTTMAASHSRQGAPSDSKDGEFGRVLIEENQRLKKVVEKLQSEIDELAKTRGADQMAALDEIKLIMKKQEMEIELLRKENNSDKKEQTTATTTTTTAGLSSSSSSNLDQEPGKLASQERFWQARLESIVQKHNEEMERIQRELDTMQIAAKQAKEQLEHHLEATQRCSRQDEQKPHGPQKDKEDEDEKSRQTLSKADPLQTRSSGEAGEDGAHLAASLLPSHPSPVVGFSAPSSSLSSSPFPSRKITQGTGHLERPVSSQEPQLDSRGGGGGGGLRSRLHLGNLQPQPRTTNATAIGAPTQRPRPSCSSVDGGPSPRGPLSSRTGRNHAQTMDEREECQDPNNGDGELVQILGRNRSGGRPVPGDKSESTNHHHDRRDRPPNGSQTPQIEEGKRQTNRETNGMAKQVEWVNGRNLAPFPVESAWGQKQTRGPPLEMPRIEPQVDGKNNSYENVFKRDHLNGQRNGEQRSNLLDHEYASMRSLWASSQEICRSISELAEENPSFLKKYRRNARFDLDVTLEELGLDPQRTRISNSELEVLLNERKKELKQSSAVKSTRKKCKVELNGLIQRSGIGSLPARNSVATSSFEIRLGKNLNSAKNQVIKTWRNALRTKESQAETTQISSFNTTKSSLPSGSQSATTDRLLKGTDRALNSKGPIGVETHPEDCLFKSKPLPNIYCDDPKMKQDHHTVLEPPVKDNLEAPIPAPRRSKSPKESSKANSEISSITHADVVHDFNSDISEEDHLEQEQSSAWQDRNAEPSDTEEDHSFNWDSETSRAIGNSIALAEVHDPQDVTSAFQSIEDLEGLSSVEEELLHEIDASKIKLKKPPPGSRIDMLKNTIEQQLRNRTQGPSGGVDLAVENSKAESDEVMELSLSPEPISLAQRADPKSSSRHRLTTQPTATSSWDSD
ncbi:uncharacterized protein LOC131879907 [Tigriopus californicus]|uniref:uncharacterized protein LOC131879907 n=1 Tax=Tigriopus californicus TaxID=6832 RepID=UPI0027DA86B3|nr:uncharacterized protein LOC131879907 [Tigriopus californicus]